MFVDRELAYASGNDSCSYEDSDLSPVSTLFPSDSPWNLATPPSYEGSESPMDPDDMPFGTPLFSSPAGTHDEYFAVGEGANDGLPAFLDQNILFECDSGKTQPEQSILGYTNLTSCIDSTYQSFDVQDNIHAQQTGMELDLYSQMSSLGSSSFPMSYSLPSQTTFAGIYDMQTSLHEVRPLSVGSSDSNEGHNYLLHAPRERNNFRSVPAETPRSCPAPRLRPSLTRRPAFESLQISMDLRHPNADRFGGRQLRRQRLRRGSSALSTVPSHIRVQKEAEKKCEWPGCNKKFQRQEHLKRHEKTHVNPDSFVCQFCGKLFGRSDNLKQHITLHTRKTPRTEYFAGAQKVHDEMSRKPRRAARNLTPADIKPELETKKKQTLRSQDAER